MIVTQCEGQLSNYHVNGGSMTTPQSDGKKRKKKKIKKKKHSPKSNPNQTITLTLTLTLTITLTLHNPYPNLNLTLNLTLNLNNHTLPPNHTPPHNLTLLRTTPFLPVAEWFGGRAAGLIYTCQAKVRLPSRCFPQFKDCMDNYSWLLD